MTDVTRFKGAVLPSATVVVERTAVAHFAAGVIDDNPVFRDPAAAAAAGLDAIPGTPTFSFVMNNYGMFPELQSPRGDEKNPFNVALGELMATGGLLLHGGQEFHYHRPVLVGDQLTSEAHMSDVYAKTNAAGKVMTFLETSTTWRDADGADVVTSRMTLIHMGRAAS